MSKLTKLIRSIGAGPILDAIEASGKVKAVEQDLKDGAVVAIDAAGAVLRAIFVARVASKLGAYGGFASTTFDKLSQEFEDWLDARLQGPSDAAPK